ncbi:unnamed protein product [Durusdinium trenchii]|uniref:Uncharacterized protein n=1 Tax=Durusdinium trenchii TaxID=1381693 RepID=A0ABP0MRB0_9DINO
MPLDRELSQRLERRRGRADADATSPAEPAVDRERYEAHIDQELKSKLRQQSELIMRQTNSGMSDSCKRPTRYEAHIDQELAKKLQKRQTELQLEGEGRPRSTKVEGLRGNSTFEAHIDNELAAKLRKRLEVEMAPQTAAPAARLEKDEVRQNPGDGDGDLDGELAQRLRQRRQVVNAQGDVFEKGAQQQVLDQIQSIPETKQKRRFWWLFCCSLVVTAYGAYQLQPVE